MSLCTQFCYMLKKSHTNKQKIWASLFIHFQSISNANRKQQPKIPQIEIRFRRIHLKFKQPYKVAFLSSMFVYCTIASKLMTVCACVFFWHFVFLNFKIISFFSGRKLLEILKVFGECEQSSYNRIRATQSLSMNIELYVHASSMLGMNSFLIIRRYLQKRITPFHSISFRSLIKAKTKTL